MNGHPLWLPAMVSVEGEWWDIVSRLYAVFYNDFHHGRPTYEGRPVWWNQTLNPGEQYEEGFWHLITRTDNFIGDRLLDTRRAERLPWCAPTIVNAAEAEIKRWDYLEGSGRKRTYLWLRDFDYVVVLEKRIQRGKSIAFLITAYHVDGERAKDNLERKFRKRVS